MNSESGKSLPKLLEVIVTSVEEALEAQAGGADRLELVRSLDQGGLTPALSVVESVVWRVSVPVRVMLRQNPTMSVSSDHELDALQSDASSFAKLPVHGLVAGFVRNGEIDGESLRKVMDAAPNLPITFHRAFESVGSPENSLDQLRTMAAVDRLLIRAGGRFPLHYLNALQSRTEGHVQIITGTGLDSNASAELSQFPALRELHIGRAAREPVSTEGKVSRLKIAAIKKVIS